MTIAFQSFARTTTALVVTLISAAPAFAEQRACAEITSLRSGAAETPDSSAPTAASQPTPLP